MVCELAAIAEDDDMFRFALAKLFRHYGYGVVEFSDGSQLADYLTATSGVDVPALVVLADVVLPGMTGLDACSAARTAGCTSRFIFMSAFDDDEVLSEALALGPTGIFKKPFDVDALRMAVDEISGAIPRDAQT